MNFGTTEIILILLVLMILALPIAIVVFLQFIRRRNGKTI